MQAQVVDYLLVLLIAEAHVFHPNVPVHPGELRRPRLILGLGGLVHQIKDPLGGGAGGLQLADDVGHLVYRSGKPAGVEHEAGEIAYGDPLQEKQYGAEHAYKGQGEVVDEVHRGPCHGTVIFGIIISVHSLLVPFVKAAYLCPLLVIGLGGLLAAYDLLHKAVELAQHHRALVE